MQNRKIHSKVTSYSVYVFSSRIQSVVIGIITKVAFWHKHEDINGNYIKFIKYYILHIYQILVAPRMKLWGTHAKTSVQSLKELFIEVYEV